MFLDNGGAGILRTLDGKETVRKDFTDPDGDRITDSLKQFSGEYATEVPAGRHTVVVENQCQDWFVLNVRVEGAIIKSTPSLVGWGIQGKTTGIVWVQQEERTWRAIAVQKKKLPTVEISWLSLPLKGTWRAEICNTSAGKIMSTFECERSQGSSAKG